MMDTSTLDNIDDLWQKYVNPSPKPEVILYVPHYNETLM